MVVIGDSSAAQHPLHSDCWPWVWARACATWARRSTSSTWLWRMDVEQGQPPSPPSTAETAVERAIIEAPDVIIIALGAPTTRC